MKKKLIISISILINSLFYVWGQNNWIDFNKIYYKVEIKKEGIYRITYQELFNAGFPINTTNPKNLQLFFRSQEIPISVKGEEDNIIDQHDYIEFYGITNDNTLDKILYEKEEYQTNPYTTLYSDRTAYFLTFTLDGTAGLRILNAPVVSNAKLISYYKARIVLSQKQAGNWNKFAFGTVYPQYLQKIKEAAFDAHWSSAKGFTDMFRGFYSRNTETQIKINYNLNIDNYYYGANDQATIKVRMTSRSYVKNRHTVEIWAGPNKNNQRKLGDLYFSSFKNGVFETKLKESDFPTSDGKLTVSYVLLREEPGNHEFVSLSAIELNYPRKLDMQNQRARDFNFYNHTASVTIDNVLPNTSSWLIIDSMQVKKIHPLSSTTSQITFSASSESSVRSLKVFMQNEPYQIFSIKQATLEPIDTQKDYLIITHHSLMDAVQIYADYRSSQQGGGFDIAIQTVENLYNHFTYGEVTPLAFRRYAEYMLKKGSPRFLFIIGKGLNVLQRYEHRRPASESWKFKSLVPSYGFPPSDFAITERLNGSGNVPAIPTGRISVMNNQQILDYLNKVKQHEQSLPNELWHKRFLHLTGGKSESEQQRFQQYGFKMADIAEQEYLGAKVKSFRKGGFSPSEIISVSDEVNKGVGMIYMFGHSSTSAVDFSLGPVSDDILGYDNDGKYPLLLINGCNAGNIFQKGNETLGENWLFTPDRGAIAVMAHSYFGFDNFQFQYNNYLYNTLYGDSVFLSRSIGEAVQETIRRFVKVNSSITTLSNTQQFILQADPAVKIFNAPAPDYHLDQTEIYTLERKQNNKKITAQTDSFQIILPISNFGRVSTNNITIRVIRTFPNGITKKEDKKIFPVFHKDSVRIVIRQSEEDKENAAGNNTFTFIIDPENTFTELRKTNNKAVYELFFPQSKLNILKPYPYSIVNKKNLEIHLYNPDFGVKNRTYTFQLDTSINFNSSIFKEVNITSNNYVRWNTELPVGKLGDTIAYYIRSRYTNFTSADDTTWINSTFSYIPKTNIQGWSQINFEHLSKNSFENLKINTANKSILFSNKTTVIKAYTTGDINTNPNWKNYRLEYNDVLLTEEGSCSIWHNVKNTILVMFFDRKTGRPYIPLQKFNTPPYTCGPLIPKSIVLSLRDNLLFGRDRLDLLIEAVKPDDYVFLMSTGRNRFKRYRTKQLNALSSIGLDTTRFKLLENGDPLIVLGEKGSTPGTANVVFPSQSLPIKERTLEKEFSFTFTERNGKITTVFIGPAKKWKNISIHLDQRDTSVDYWAFDVYGFDKNKQNKTLLRESITENHHDISNINPNIYPYIQLQATFLDSVNFTPLQFNKWLVSYQESPEGILFLGKEIMERENLYTVQEGDSLHFNFIFKNITDIDFSEPLIVTYRIDNQPTFYDTLTKLTAQDSLSFQLSISSIGLVGKHRLNVNINPRFQVEKDYSNNFLEYQFLVKKDNIHPILDVVFDGRHITDGEIVSVNPIITVSIKDENKFLIIDDTAQADIYMKYPNEEDFQRINFNTPKISWEKTKENDFRIYYKPKNMKDGKYTLKVQAYDLTGNKSGNHPYQVNFEVINKFTVTHSDPYPNPFSDRVRFKFMLTGSKIPQLKIQIITTIGKIVREITQDEIGIIQIGNNEYIWNGTDKQGYQLPNGIYIYQIFIQIDGKIETSKGKICLMR